MGSAPQNVKQNQPSGAASAQFPGKLHDIMTYTEREGLSDIISWVQNGRAILVHDPERLLKILPHFGFSQTKYRSFQRQLNMWHWERILDGPYKGGWIHPYFIRGNKILCRFMSRQGIPKPNMLHLLLNNSIEKIESNPMINAPTEVHSEKITLSFSGRTTANDTYTRPMSRKTYSSPTKLYIDEWEPLPTSSNDSSTLLEGLFPHFVELFDATLFPESSSLSMFEPTPIQEEEEGMNQLLEPLSAEVIEKLF